MARPLAVAVQMDPIETIAADGDTTLALMRAAHARGHRLFHYSPDDLVWREGQILARARPLVPQPWGATPHWRWTGEAAPLDLVDEIDVVLMRQDPPFDMAYITATHLLEEAVARGTLVVNDPAAVRNAPEKLFVLRFAELMPPTLVTRSLAEAEAFRRAHGEVVVKPLYGNAGAAVFHAGASDPNLPALVELFGRVWREPFMVQAFLPAVAAGDKRIILLDGEPAGAINRLPRAGEIRSNLAAGGRAEPTSLTAREEAICRAIGPDLRARGLLLAGIDVIGGMLTEINVTSPTGVVAIDRFDGRDTPGRFWEIVETRHAAGPHRKALP